MINYEITSNGQTVSILNRISEMGLDTLNTVFSRLANFEMLICLIMVGILALSVIIGIMLLITYE